MRHTVRQATARRALVCVRYSVTLPMLAHLPKAARASSSQAEANHWSSCCRRASLQQVRARAAARRCTSAATPARLACCCARARQCARCAAQAPRRCIGLRALGACAHPKPRPQSPQTLQSVKHQACLRATNTAGRGRWAPVRTQPLGPLTSKPETHEVPGLSACWIESGRERRRCFSAQVLRTSSSGLGWWEPCATQP